MHRNLDEPVPEIPPQSCRVCKACRLTCPYAHNPVCINVSKYHYLSSLRSVQTHVAGAPNPVCPECEHTPIPGVTHLPLPGPHSVGMCCKLQCLSRGLTRWGQCTKASQKPFMQRASTQSKGLRTQMQVRQRTTVATFVASSSACHVASRGGASAPKQARNL